MPTINKPKKKSKPLNEDIARKKRMEVYNKTLWKRLTNLKRQENPLCEVCLMQGIIRPSLHTHHLISFVSGNNDAERDCLAFDYDNLISLCPECHNRLHHSDLRGCTTKEAIKRKLEEIKLKV